MKRELSMMLVLLNVLFAGTAMAYGGGGGGSSKSTCVAPVFSKHNPAKQAVVTELSAFSFEASGNTRPDSIQVKVKDREIPVKASKTNGRVTVEGTLPEPVESGFVLLKVAGRSLSGCPGYDNWLVKIGVGEPSEE